MTICGTCNRNPLATPWELDLQLCVACADPIGAMPMRPLRRPPVPCSRCNHRKFIRAVPRELGTTRNASGQLEGQAAPMAVTYRPEYIPHAGMRGLDARQGHGLLEMFVCCGCGFIEWYCSDPENVPVGPHYLTEIVDYGAGGGPYR